MFKVIKLMIALLSRPLPASSSPLLINSKCYLNSTEPNIMRHGPGQGGLPFHCCVSALLELQTKFREYFTITKEAPAKPFPG